jgi:3-oxoacyl-[acyl-carrier-protein] synthase-3
MSFRILGTGSAAPEYVMTNDEMATIVETNDEWIRTRSGIRERRICTTETITDLCVEAAQKALDNAGVKPEELDLIICSTIRGEFISPSQACVTLERIGAHCPAFDVNAACAGFIYAMDVAAGFFARGRVGKVLVVGMDNMSNSIDWGDRRTCVLFGDGGGAVVLGQGEDLLSIEITAEGNSDVIRIPRGENTCGLYQHASERPVVYMNGREVYKFAVNAMSGGLQRVIEQAGVRQEEVDYVIPHQANLRIIRTAQARLSIPEDRYVCNIDRYGNTSSGSIPIALDELNRSGRLQKGQLIAMSAFGGGLTTGSCLLRWNR